MVSVYLILFIGATTASLFLTRSIRNLAVRHGWVTQPDSARHLHTTPVPRLGGVAIYASFVLFIAALALAKLLFHVNVPLPPELRYIFLPATMVFALGLYDDVHPLSPYVKFAVQCVAATLLCFVGGYRIANVHLLHHYHPLGVGLSLVATIIWVVWITNAFNLLDGLDGLAAGSALFSTLVMFVVSLVTNNALISFVTLILAGAILGFLRFNFNPATIFLGDCGSLFIGFMLSAIALSGSHMSSTLVAVAIPVVSFGLPLIDTMIAVMRRFLSGKPLFTGDSEHIHHRLLKRGLSHRQVVVLLYAISGAFGLLSLTLLYPNGHVVGLVLVVVGLGVFLGVQQLGYHEFVELRRLARRTMEQKQVIINNLCIRRAGEDLRSCATFAGIARILDNALATNAFDEVQVTVVARGYGGTDDDVAPFSRSAPGQYSYRWRRPVTSIVALEPGPPVWMLQLQLIGERGGHQGTIKVCRHSAEKPLLVDVNSLTSGFDRALADACERAAAAHAQAAASKDPLPLSEDAGLLSGAN